MIFCAVVLSKDVEQHLKQQGVKDSKDVPPKKRGLLREVIMEECIEYNTIVVHAQDIDRRRKGGESMNDIKVQAVSDLLSNIQTNEVTTAYIDAFDNVGKRVWLVVVVGGGWWVVMVVVMVVVWFVVGVLLLGFLLLGGMHSNVVLVLLFFVLFAFFVFFKRPNTTTHFDFICKRVAIKTR
jgi:hypothetical protein